MKNMPAQPNQNSANMLRQQDLEKMMDQIENLARSGNHQARQLLSEMQRMMNNLQAGGRSAARTSSRARKTARCASRWTSSAADARPAEADGRDLQVRPGPARPHAARRSLDGDDRTEPADAGSERSVATGHGTAGSRPTGSAARSEPAGPESARPAAGPEAAGRQSDGQHDRRATEAGAEGTAASSRKSSASSSANCKRVSKAWASSRARVLARPAAR